MMRLDGAPEVMLPGEVAAIFRCDPKTINTWTRKGKLNSFRTPGGHRRYYRADVEAFLNRDGGRP